MEVVAYKCLPKNGTVKLYYTVHYNTYIHCHTYAMQQHCYAICNVPFVQHLQKVEHIHSVCGIITLRKDSWARNSPYEFIVRSC